MRRSAAGTRAGDLDVRACDTMLDELVPRWDVRSCQTVWIASDPAHVYQTARNIDLGSPWPVRALMAMRTAPAALVMSIRSSRGTGQSGAAVHKVGGAVFTLIAEEPGQEFVLGLMGRFWTPSGGLLAADAEQFRKAAPPGQAQAFWSFRVVPKRGGTQLFTETRVRCGDESSRRRFTRYWWMVRLGSALVRWSILHRIRRLAQQPAWGTSR